MQIVKWVLNISPATLILILLEGIFERHAISVANGLTGKVKGVITRERTTKNNFEESVIDLVCLSQDLVLELESIIIDEPKEYCLESKNTIKNGVTKVTTIQLLASLNLNGTPN